MATLNAAECFDLKTLGAIAPGYQADFFLTDDLTKLPIHEVFYKGTLVVQSGQLEDTIWSIDPSLTKSLMSLSSVTKKHLLELSGVIAGSSEARSFATVPSRTIK